MSATVKFAGFILGLAVVFVSAIWVGTAIGPDDGDRTAQRSQTHNGASAGDLDPVAESLPAGLMSTQEGYNLELAQSLFEPGNDEPLRFRITDSIGVAVRQYVDSHEKQLHLIVVRRDMVAFQHVHPILGSDGTWSAPVDLSRTGVYRVFADFTPAGGQALILGADVHVAGRYDPRPLPAVETTTTVDGYTVTLSGSPKANESSMLTLSVSHDRQPVTDLLPTTPEPPTAGHGH